jgi:hypothetical protein
MGLNETYLIGIPAVTTTLAFFIPVLLFNARGEYAARVENFFQKLDTPINPATELGDAGFTGRRQLALVGKVTTGMGLACFLIVLFSSPGRDRIITTTYAIVTTLVGCAFIAAGRVPRGATATPARPEPALVVEEK